jgi:Ca-activated chloride channel family protein
MPSFTDPRWLWALVALPLLIVLHVLAARRAKRAVRSLVGERTEHVLLEHWRPGRRVLSAGLRLAAFAALVLGAAAPEWGRELVRRPTRGSDLVLAIDVSSSMDVRDVPPSRLEEVRREALAVLDRVEGSRVAVVAFSGDAVRLCPLTQDRAAARLTIESLSSRSVSEPGTDLGRALQMIARTLPGGWREEQAALLWTDGEDLERGAAAGLDALVRAGVRVFTIGVGTPAGDVVPVLDDQGRAVDIKLDERGVAVRSHLDEGLLRTIASKTRGAYFSAQRPGGELPRLLATLGSLGRVTRGTRLTERPVARFRVFAFLAALLLAADLAIPRRRRARERSTSAPTASGARAAAAAIALATLLASARPASAQSDWARGDQAYRAGRYAEAESLYARRLKRGGPDEVRVNRETARARAGHGSEAEGGLERLASGPTATRAGQAAGYNLGTLRGERKDWNEGLAALRKVLERDPGDQDARWNYEYMLRQRDKERNQPPPPTPNPSPGGGGGGGGGGGSPPPQGQIAPPPPPPGSGPSRMSRAQAERMLGALEDLQRLEAQQRRQNREVRKRPGRDW